jgi:hypothetical protein
VINVLYIHSSCLYMYERCTLGVRVRVRVRFRVKVKNSVRVRVITLSLPGKDLFNVLNKRIRDLKVGFVLQMNQRNILNIPSLSLNLSPTLTL